MSEQRTPSPERIPQLAMRMVLPEDLFVAGRVDGLQHTVGVKRMQGGVKRPAYFE